jgi:hypothetical protein
VSVRSAEEPGLSDADRRLIENVARHGTHVVKIVSSRPTSTPDWAFTIGLHQNFAHPEVVVFGLRPELAHNLLNDVRDLVGEGHRFEQGCVTDLVLGDLPCAFREVRPGWHPPYLGTMRWFYRGRPVPVVQMFWPDREGRFPWEPAFDTVHSGEQPLLFHDDPSAAANAGFLAELEAEGQWPPPASG